MDTYSWKLEPIPSSFLCHGVLQGPDGCDSVVLEHVFLLLLLGQFLPTAICRAGRDSDVSPILGRDEDSRENKPQFSSCST